MRKKQSLHPFKDLSNTAIVTRILSLIIITLSALHVTAQVDTGRNITSASAKSDAIIERKLVDLALKGPQYQLSEHQIRISEYQVLTARRSWLNLLVLSANYNDQTFAKRNTAQNAYVYPKFFFGLNIPLGVIFSKGAEVKFARENVEMTRLNQEQTARLIKAEVLSKYKQYKNYGTLIAMQRQVNNDEQDAFLQTERKFREGSISMEVFSVASKSHVAEIANELNLQLQQDLIRIDIEKLIGVSLDSVIK